jgi:alkylhydroperoxidase family enzyme
MPGNASALNELRNAGVSDAEIVEILAHVGLNLFTNYFNHVADTEIDFPLVTTATSKSVA